MDQLLPFVCRAARNPHPPDDAELLAAFLAGRDEAAFTELVRRHGPLVWGVCRRWLREPADVEDAFQATFLVLIRRAPTISRPLKLSNWLYGVAMRSARKLRDRSARVHRHEESHPDLESVAFASPQPDADLRPLLDEEICRLPDKYRLPILFCHLQGLTRKQAAARLGCPEGTLSVRLARALERLRRRLVARDLAPATAVSLLVVPKADAVPPLLVRATVSTLLKSPSAPARIAGLAEGVLHMLFVKRFSAVLGAIFVVAVLGTGTGLFLRQSAGTPAVAQTPGETAKKPAPPAVSIKVVTDGAGAIRQLVVTEDGDEAAVTTPRALGRYLKRLHRETPAAALTIQFGGTARADVLRSLSGVCRDAGFARFSVKATEAVFDLVDDRKDQLGLFDAELLSRAVLQDNHDRAVHSAVEWLRAQGEAKPSNPASITYQGLAALALSQAPGANTKAAIQALGDATTLESKIEGVWKVDAVKIAGKDQADTPLTGWVWVIANDHLITVSRDKTHIGTVCVGQKGSTNTITATFVRNQPGTTLKGAFTVGRDRLTLTFPEGIQSEAGKSELVISLRREARK